MIVTKPGMKPSSIRVDQLDKDVKVRKKKNGSDSEINKKESQGTKKDSAKDTTTNCVDIVKEKAGSPKGSEDPIVKTEVMPVDERADVEISEKEVNITDEGSNVPERREQIPYPEIIHFGIRPPQLSYAGNQE